MRRELPMASFGKVLRRDRHTTAPNGALLPPTERSGGVPKSDHRRDNEVIASDGRAEAECEKRIPHGKFR